MCGFAGIVRQSSRSSAGDLRDEVKRMAATIAHRGPDDESAWGAPGGDVALAFRRLAIIDRSPAGRQPMLSASGRYVITFNGEVYNFRSIRKQLSDSGVADFRGHSDTEVLLTAIERWGVQRAVQACAGMFAFALWDIHERCLYLGRDRMGEKPLYYGLFQDELVFGSELRVLQACDRFEGKIDRRALGAFVRTGYVPSPRSIYANVRKLPPGTLLRYQPSRQAALPAPEAYWSPAPFLGKTLPWTDDGAALADQLHDLLKCSVREQMVADVPVGAFLSGGIDSSLVVALMQSQSARAVKTFSIGFHDRRFNEAHHAKAVARHLGTEHTELYITPSDALEVVPRLADIFDEPFADASQIPTFLVAQLARQQVTVSLSGDGADELFCGYPRYRLANKAIEHIYRIPAFVREPMGRALDNLSLVRAAAPRSKARNLYWAAQMLKARCPSDFYDSFLYSWQDPAEVVVEGAVPQEVDEAALETSFLRQVMYNDMRAYLPDDILVKVDRATMGVSLESRAPLLDHRIVEFALQLPKPALMRGRQGKSLLRRVLYEYVPAELVERPKKGFGVPVGDWLRDELRDWAEHLLSPTRLRDGGLFHSRPIRLRWQEHVSGQRDWTPHLWNILMFQAWMQNQTTPAIASAA